MSLVVGLLVAGAVPSVPFDRAAHQAALNEMIEKRDYKVFSERVFAPRSAEEARSTLDWMKEQWFAGNSSIVPMFYANLLWRISEKFPADVQAGTRGTAAAAILYTYGVTFIDGARCGDQTAPAHRRDQLATFIPGFWSAIKTYPLEQRHQMVEIAVRMESRTATVRDSRGDVEFLCVNGMEEMTYNLKHGRVEERTQGPGEIGRQMAVIGDGSYRPSLRDEKVWRPIAAKAREDLPVMLLQLVTTDDEKKTAIPKP